MKSYRIEFFAILQNDNTEKFLIDYILMFECLEDAKEWAWLTAQTSNTMKNFTMVIKINILPETINIYYYAGQE